MGIKKFRPTTPSRVLSQLRFLRSNSKSSQKELLAKRSGKGGRNNNGRITSRHRGGGHKRRYRVIDFKRDKKEVPGTVASIQYDPNRTARIALINFADGEKRYILAPDGLEVGATVITSDTCDILPGNHMHLHAIPLGTLIHNIEMQMGRGGQLCRSAGASAQVMAKEYVLLRLPSDELRHIHRNCTAWVK